MTAQDYITISNDSAMVFASSAVYDPDENQLVAAQCVSPVAGLLKAIKASLMNNNKRSYITLRPPQGSSIYLASARKGYIQLNANLEKAHAQGHLCILLHPLAGDPSESTADFCYVVTTTGEDLHQKFTERLNLGLPWPVLPIWAFYLLRVGEENGVVQKLPIIGDEFTHALRVSLDPVKWQNLISHALKHQHVII